MSVIDTVHLTMKFTQISYVMGMLHNAEHNPTHSPECDSKQFKGLTQTAFTL